MKPALVGGNLAGLIGWEFTDVLRLQYDNPLNRLGETRQYIILSLIVLLT
jgi:hypothetical protein